MSWSLAQCPPIASMKPADAAVAVAFEAVAVVAASDGTAPEPTWA